MKQLAVASVDTSKEELHTELAALSTFHCELLADLGEAAAAVALAGLT